MNCKYSHGIFECTKRKWKEKVGVRACWIFAYNLLTFVFSWIKVKYVCSWEQITHLSHRQETGLLHPFPAVKPSACCLILWVPQFLHQATEERAPPALAATFLCFLFLEMLLELMKFTLFSKNTFGPGYRARGGDQLVFCGNMET